MLPIPSPVRSAAAGADAGTAFTRAAWGKEARSRSLPPPPPSGAAIARNELGRGLTPSTFYLPPHSAEAWPDEVRLWLSLLKNSDLSPVFCVRLWWADFSIPRSADAEAFRVLRLFVSGSYSGSGGNWYGRRYALVAIARKLAVILHRMWIDGTPFSFTQPEAAS